MRALLPIGIAVVVLVFWRTPFVYPLKVFVVFLHELSHGLAAVLTGGSIERILLSADQGGLCVTRGGWGFVITSAGYLGSLFWGAVLLILSARARFDRELLALVGVATIVLTLVYVRSAFGLLYGLLAGAALTFVAVRLGDRVSGVVLSTLGVTSCLYAVGDIFSDLLLRSVPGSDANALAAMTGIPGILWGVFWAGLSIVGTILAFRIALSGGRSSRPAELVRPETP